MVDNPENVIAAEETEGTSGRQEVLAIEKDKFDPVENERRSKKRNERPPPSEEERTMPARATKRTKTVAPRRTKKAASTNTGKVSEPNTNSSSKAQDQLPPSTTIGYTKPLVMIKPTPTVQISSSSSSSSESSSSSSEGAESNSSHEPISKLLRKAPKLKPNPKPQSTKTPIVKEFVSEGNSVLDHLTSHISGDAFTTSNLNSPNHPINKFLSDPVHTYVDPEPEVHYHIPSPPPIKSPEYVFHAPPMHFEQEINDTIIV
jgi:hypothetical protein